MYICMGMNGLLSIGSIAFGMVPLSQAEAAINRTS
jgi:hypothetical protein